MINHEDLVKVLNQKIDESRLTVSSERVMHKILDGLQQV